MIKRKFKCYYGLVDTYKYGITTMREHPLGDAEFECGSIKRAQKEATRLAMTNEEIERRFAYEQPQWTKIYLIESENDIEIRNGMTRLFRRDVHDTGKVAYIHLTWLVEETK